MHSYSVGFTERRIYPFYFAFCAIAITAGLRELLGWIGWDGGLGVYVPSGFALYGIIYYLFENFIWRWSYFTFGKTPNLNGEWRGVLRSSHSSLTKEHEIELRIVQTWVDIRLTLETSRSISMSDMACIIAVSPHEFELRWEYHAESKNPAEGNEFNHRGVTKLRLKTQQGQVQPEMNGDYYTQTKRNGVIFAKRVDK